MNSKQDNRQGLVHLPNLISGALQKPSHEDSQQLLPAKLKDNGYAEVSIFGGEMASPSDVLVAVNKLSTAFPKQSQSFWELLALRIGEKGMTASELEFAVNEVIDNFTYQSLTIADIMKQGKDKRFKLLTYSAMVAECNRNGTTTNDYCPIRVSGMDKPAWISKADKALYNIPDEL